MIEILLNGAVFKCFESMTVGEVVAQLQNPNATDGIAVAVNREVLPRSLWQTTTLCERDVVEIVTAVAGG